MKIKDKEFLIFYKNVISNFLEGNFSNEEIKYRDKVFFNLIQEIAKNSIEDKFYAILIKNFLKKNFLIYDIGFTPKEYTAYQLKQINYDEILNYLEELNFIFKLHNENNFMTDFIIYLVRNLCDVSSSNNNQPIIFPSLNEEKNTNMNNASNCTLNSLTKINMSNYLTKFYLIK